MLRAASFPARRGVAERRRRFVCAFKAQLCGIRFPLEANRDLGQQVYTIRMHNAQAAHVNCPLRPPHEVHPPHQIGVIKFTYPAGACELSDSSFRFPSSAPAVTPTSPDRTRQLKYSQAAISAH